MIQIPESHLVNVDKLRVDGQNPNRMSDGQLKRLQSSIERFGFIVPVITNKDYLVADGEQRLTAARKLGMKQVSVVALPVKDVDRRLLRQVLNKLRGEHELVADALEFERIIEAGHEDTLKQLLDLSDSQLERYLAEIHEPNSEDYEIPEIDKIKTDIKRGDIYKLGTHRLMCGDATIKADVSKLMNGTKADMVFTDPPYGAKSVQRSGVLKKKYIPIQNDDMPFNPFHLLKLAPKIILFGGNYFATQLPLSSGWCVWDKKAEHAKRHDQGDCELIWTNLKRPPRIYRNAWVGWFKEGESNKTPRLHPAQKPIKLLSYILKDTSNNPDIILDPYGGSGSTLIACEQTGRKCCMMEIDPRYCQVIVNRWEQYTGQKASKISKGG